MCRCDRKITVIGARFTFRCVSTVETQRAIKTTMKDVITAAAAAAMKPAELVSAIVTNVTTIKKAYLSNAVLLVALDGKIGEKSANAALRKAGLSQSAIGNARVITRVYAAVVEPGHATWDWLAEVQFREALAINAAIDKVGVTKLAEWGLFSRSSEKNFGEFELVAETGLNRQERAAKAEKETAEKAAKAAKEAEEAKKTAEAATTAPTETAPTENAPTETPAADTAKDAVATAKPPPSPMVEFETTAERLEAIAVALIAKGDEVTMGTINARLAALGKAVGAAVAAKAKAKKAA